MKAVAVFPGKADSMHLADLPEPSVDDVPNGRGVLVEVLRVGVDGTDEEINAGEYGAAPKGYDFLVTGHESFGRVLEVGPNVRDLRPGDHVTATVRRPGASIYDLIGAYDMTTDDTYYERGINLLHGFLTERYVEDPDYIVKVPAALKEVGVLMEPVSIVEKGIEQAYEIQRRLGIWRPRRAAVVGAGSLGLLATLVLRLRGLEVTTLARTDPPTPNSELVEALDARYESTHELPLSQAAEKYGPFDLIFEATGASSVAFEGMEALGKNGVLVLTGISGGDRKIEVPGDHILTGFVLGNKVAVGTVNANRRYFERGVQDVALAEARYPGWLERLLTHPVRGLDGHAEMVHLLNEEKDAIKVVVEVADL
ncbi:MAG: glucose 1-dehydrogenase [Rubrobacter sp.]|nr:glucose 1-dehydrogenase [Rubrobacter sp.]MDQ3637303.1 glucose 1-dehydrogenase [Actinomycetota bacterium]